MALRIPGTNRGMLGGTLNRSITQEVSKRHGFSHIAELFLEIYHVYCPP